MEKRKHRRVPFQVMATVASGQISISGIVDNLSMKGMFLSTREKLPDGSPLEVSLTLHGSSPTLSIKLKGRALGRLKRGLRSNSWKWTWIPSLT